MTSLDYNKKPDPSIEVDLGVPLSAEFEANPDYGEAEGGYVDIESGLVINERGEEVIPSPAPARIEPDYPARRDIEEVDLPF